MASAWRRTGAEMLLTGHTVVLYRDDSRVFPFVPWAVNAYIFAQVWREVDEKMSERIITVEWKWVVRMGGTRGGRVIAFGGAASEGGARAAAKRRIAPLVAENRVLFTTSPDVQKWEADGYTRREAA